jgi:hypothetical protein
MMERDGIGNITGTAKHEAHEPSSVGTLRRPSLNALGRPRRNDRRRRRRRQLPTTSRRGYSHHGVYAGRGRVVDYSGLSGFWQCGPVEEVSLSRFANGHPVRIVHHAQSPYLAEEIVRRARSRLGENDYRLLTNNCEHFCNWCVSGINISTQVARPLRLPFRVLGALFHA